MLAALARDLETDFESALGHQESTVGLAVAPLDARGLSQQAWIQQRAPPALVSLPARTEQGTARAWCANPAAAAS